MAIIHALLALGSFAAVLTAGTVQAQCLPPEGPVSVTFTATPTSPLKPMPIGSGKDSVVVNQLWAHRTTRETRFSATWTVGASSLVPRSRSEDCGSPWLLHLHR